MKEVITIVNQMPFYRGIKGHLVPFWLFSWKEGLLSRDRSVAQPTTAW